MTTPPPQWNCSNGYVALTFDDGPTGLTQRYLDTLKNGGANATFFDIGANIGAFTVPLARAVGDTGSVHAFEPLHIARARLERTIGAHECNP